MPIPEHHRRAANILTMISGSGVVPLAWGLNELAFWPTIFGVALTAVRKLLVTDRAALRK